VNNTVHKVELRADSKGSRQRVGELNLKFSGIELDLGALTAATNGDSHRGIPVSQSLVTFWHFCSVCFKSCVVFIDIYFNEKLNFDFHS